MVLDLRIGDILRLKKPHPCGGNEWLVTRLGADIGIKCLKCGRTVMIERAVLERRIKAFISRGNEDQAIQ
jgi:hypothetical protein